ncbi:MAG: aldehyde ferredoxin oxidoreductase N-terminal domain-containing protein [Chloroflexota bacterium]
MAEYGYAGEVLKVDLTDGKITRLPTADYVDRFIGGRGLAARLYWDMVPPGAGALSPENCLICASGPVAGFPGFAGGRWVICGKSPEGERGTFNYANLGGRWGTWLKYAGYDALVVQGRAERPVYLFISNDTVEVRDAADLWGGSALEVFEGLQAWLGKGASVLTIGPAAENLVTFATVLADEGASGSGGLGAVMGSKNLKAVVVEGKKRPTAADPARLRRLAEHLRAMNKKPPVSMWGIPGRTRAHVCYGCVIGCDRQMYTAEDGRRYKHFCQPTNVYQAQAAERYGGWNEVQLLAIRLCDGYGLDTAVMKGLIGWVIACHRNGLLSEGETGLPVSRVGTAGFIEALTRMISYREGFGDTLARGTIAAAEAVGAEAKAMLHHFIGTRAGETKDYDPRMMMTTALLYATEPRRPIQELHDVAGPVMAWLGWAGGAEGASFSDDQLRDVALKFWGGEIAGDFSTYEGKALAARVIQDRTYAKESLVLCDMRWPMNLAYYPAGYTGETGLESRILSAITGKERDAAGLQKEGERIFNMQRAVLLREGWEPRRDDTPLDYYFKEPLKQGELFFNADCLAPDGRGQTISRQGAVVDRGAFEVMKQEYYAGRGWDVASGLPTRAGLERLQLGDVARDLDKKGLLK